MLKLQALKKGQGILVKMKIHCPKCGKIAHKLDLRKLDDKEEYIEQGNTAYCKKCLHRNLGHARSLFRKV